jgi:hypothetical protein
MHMVVHIYKLLIAYGCLYIQHCGALSLSYVISKRLLVSMWRASYMYVTMYQIHHDDFLSTSCLVHSDISYLH